MAVRYEIDRKRRIVLAAAAGSVGDEDLLRGAVAVRSDPEAEGMDEILDLRGVADVRITTRGLGEIAAHVARLTSGGKRYRVALVAPTDLVFGLARVYEALSSDAEAECRTFRSLDAARAWLRLS